MAHQNRDGVDTRLLEHVRGFIRAPKMGLLKVEMPCNLGESIKLEVEPLFVASPPAQAAHPGL